MKIITNDKKGGVSVSVSMCLVIQTIFIRKLIPELLTLKKCDIISHYITNF
jgi:hypothetical protein